MDPDIPVMKKAQLVTALKELKARGVVVNVSGNVDELKTRLHDARRDPAASAGSASLAGSVAGSAAGGVAGSVTTAVAFDGRIPDPTALEDLSKVEDVLLTRTAVHPITEACLAKLGMPQYAANPISITEDTNIIDRLMPFLHPVGNLVDEVLDAVDDMKDTVSSAAINFGVLAKIIRGRLPYESTKPEVAQIFAVFGVHVRGIDIPIPDPQADDGTAEATRASLDTVQSEIQARYRQDLVETGAEVPASLAQSMAQSMIDPALTLETGLPTDPETDQAATVFEPDQDLTREAAIIQQGLLIFLRGWMASFPAPGKKIWPQDFSKDEQADVKRFVRDYIRDSANGIDLDLRKQPVDVAEQAVDNILAKDGFPTDDAKDKTILISIFRFECNNIYNTNLRNERKKRERESVGGAAFGGGGQGGSQGRGEGNGEVVGEGEGEVDGGSEDQGEGQGRRNGKGQKRDRQDASEEDGGRKKQKTSPRFAAGGTECAACFFADRYCALIERTDPGRVCNFCFQEGYSCRVLCDDCGAIATAAGRGSGDMGMVLADCEACDFRGR